MTAAVVRSLLLVLASLLSSCGGGGGSSPPSPSPALSIFYATWTASQQDLTEGQPGSPPTAAETIGDRTLRQVVHVAIGGDRLRVRLSNIFGASPVTVAEAHLARSAGGSSIDTSTDRPITVNGSTVFVIPSMSEIVTDEVALPVPDDADLALSLYVSASTPLMTGHKSAVAATFIAPGNAVAAAGISRAAIRHLLAERDR